LQYQNDALPQLLIPVPLHPNRGFHRSFNQAELLIQCIAIKLCIKSKRNLVHRVRNTPSQIDLSIAERKRNMKIAFALKNKSENLMHLGHLAVFDDVLTTGATTENICLLLKKAGVQRIDVWSLARTSKPK